MSYKGNSSQASSGKWSWVIEKGGIEIMRGNNYDSEGEAKNAMNYQLDKYRQKEASLTAANKWIAENGVEGNIVSGGIVKNDQHFGPIRWIDDLHAVQKTGRNFVIHEISRLNKVLPRDDASTGIQYVDGCGKVTGKVGQQLCR